MTPATAPGTPRKRCTGITRCLSESFWAAWRCSHSSSASSSSIGTGGCCEVADQSNLSQDGVAAVCLGICVCGGSAHLAAAAKEYGRAGRHPCHRGHARTTSLECVPCCHPAIETAKA